MRLLKWFLLLCIITIPAGFGVFYFYPYRPIGAGITIDKIEVIKSRHELYAYANGKVVKTFTVALGQVPVGAKEYEGDKKTPEGTYTIYAKNPNSAYHKNLGISYPDAAAIAHAKSIGKPPGGDVKIHGLKDSQAWYGRFHRMADWTNGCIALNNEELDDLYAHTPVGIPIVIKP